MRGGGVRLFSTFNSLYRATRYAPDYPGLAGLGLRPEGAAGLPEPVRWDAEFAPGAEAWLARFETLAAREPDARFWEAVLAAAE